MNTAELFNTIENCFGCTACQNICPKNAIKMVADKEGFLYPEINQYCIDCKMCINVCPNKKYEKTEEIPNGNGIVLINLQITDNFGANLLAYAMEKVIGSITVDREIITVNAATHSKKLSLEEKMNQKFDFLMQKIKKYKLKTLPMFLINKKRDKYQAEINAKKKPVFEQFRKKYLNLSDLYFDANEIKQLPIDTIIVGSDIVWQPDRIKAGADVFLASGFGKAYKKIAYAASLSTNKEDELLPYKEIYRKGLNNLDYISIREADNKKFLSALTEKGINICCDPVFLLSVDEWKNMAKTPAIQDDYIFVYLLNKCSSGVKAAKKLAREKNLKIVFCSDENIKFFSDSINCTACSPDEFVGYIHNAQYVITNSFHAIVYSIIFQKQFKAYFRQEQNFKLTSLLDRLNLQDRYNADKSIEDKIDYLSVSEILENEKAKSLEYLKNTLS